jgi:hypothetical protein
MPLRNSKLRVNILFATRQLAPVDYWTVQTIAGSVLREDTAEFPVYIILPAGIDFGFN